MDTTNGRSGLFKGGGWYLLGVQSLAALCLCVWGIVSTMLLLWIIDKFLPIRMDPYEELLGADLTEHRIRHGQVGLSRAVSALRPYHRSNSIEDITTIGVNTGHNHIVNKIYETHTAKRDSIQTQKAFVNRAYNSDPEGGDENVDTRTRGRFKNQGFLNKRPGNPENDFHRALDALGHEIHEPSKLKKIPRVTKISPPEDIKKKKMNELSASQLDSLNALAASEDRFRHRFTEDDYESDVRRANMAWLD